MNNSFFHFISLHFPSTRRCCHYFISKTPLVIFYQPLSVNQEINRPNNNKMFGNNITFFSHDITNPMLLLSINIIATKFQSWQKNGLKNSGSRKKQTLCWFFCLILDLDLGLLLALIFMLVWTKVFMFSTLSFITKWMFQTFHEN